MQVKNAIFISSSTDHKKCPDTGLPEYAFIGRSNVGKSSLINMLVNKKKLARISSTPGKTQLINHFMVNERWYLVDLPGYGWAKVSKVKKASWGKMITNYLLQRQQMICLFILIDSRLPPQKIDIDFIEWVGINKIPFALIFTKADKESANKIQKNMSTFRKKLQETWLELPQMFLSSAVDKTGREEILGYIEEVNEKLEA
jgi:GTP-binding protein